MLQLPELAVLHDAPHMPACAQRSQSQGWLPVDLRFWLARLALKRSFAKKASLLLPTMQSAGEEEQERMKHDLSAGERALRGAAKPFVHHTTRGCRLHVQVRQRGGTALSHCPLSHGPCMTRCLPTAKLQLTAYEGSAAQKWIAHKQCSLWLASIWPSTPQRGCREHEHP